jgi:hypothetical protein
MAPTAQTFSAQAFKPVTIRQAECDVFAETCRVALAARHQAREVASRADFEARLLEQRELQQQFIIALAQKSVVPGTIRQTQLTYLVQKAPPPLNMFSAHSTIYWVPYEFSFFGYTFFCKTKR